MGFINGIADPIDLRRESRRRIGAALLVMACLLAFSLIASPAEAKDPKPFKAFKLKTLDGEKKTLADYTGKLTLIGFFYPQCPYCRVSVPQLQSIYDKYKDLGLSVVLINVVEEEDRLIPRFMKDHKISLPVLTGAWQPALMRDYDLDTRSTRQQGHGDAAAEWVRSR
jgi:cytochrome oxidase Cu insertion factor (SCO1/SenC/PrrC family)